MKPSEEQSGVAAPVDRVVRGGNVAELPLCSTYREFLDRFGGVDMEARQLQFERMIQSDCTINQARGFKGLERLKGGDVPISKRIITFGQS